MTKTKFPLLTSPYTLGPVNLKNRVVIPGHSMVHGDSTGLIHDRYRTYLAARAKGGAALVGMESAPIHPDSRTWIGQVELWRDEIVESLSATAKDVHEAGSKLSIILWHGGHNVSYRRGIPAMAPSVKPSVQVGEVPRAMSIRDIKEIIPYYASAAKRCADSGLDVLEVQTASDYLLGSFLSPQLNNRTDAYGGSVENRCRIVLEILESIRSILPSHMALGIRTSIYHAIPGEPDGYTIDHSLPAIEHIASTGLIDYVSVMSGSNTNFAETIAPMTFPRPQIGDMAAKVKQAVDIPVTVAGRIVTPEEAEEVLARNQADLIGLARAFIADADWMEKVNRGESERIRLCTGCNQVCLGFAGRGLPAGCNINPEAGREQELPPLEPAQTKKRVAVIGGGPAGLECARVAAERGHTVSLYEAQSQLGGALRLAASAPNREEMGSTIAWWESELALLKVKVHLESTIGSPDDLDVDEVVWATGASAASMWQMRFRPSLVDGIPGTEHMPHGRSILAGEVQVSGDVLVIDEEGGFPALNIIESLVANQTVKAITVATSSPLLGMPDLFITGEFALFAERLNKADVKLVTGVFVDHVSNNLAYTTAGESLGPFDSIVLSLGAAANPTPDGVHSIGDCVAPRDIWAAVQEGAHKGRSI